MEEVNDKLWHGTCCFDNPHVYYWLWLNDGLQDHHLFTFPYRSVTPCNIIGGHRRVTNNVIQFADTQTFHLVEWFNDVRVDY